MEGVTPIERAIPATKHQICMRCGVPASVVFVAGDASANSCDSERCGAYAALWASSHQSGDELVSVERVEESTVVAAVVS